MKVKLLTSSGIPQVLGNMFLFPSSDSVEIENYIENNIENANDLVKYLNSIKDKLSTRNWQVVSKNLIKGTDTFGNTEYLKLES